MKRKLKLFILRLKLYIYSKLSEACRKKMEKSCGRRLSKPTYWNEKRVRYLFKKYSTEAEIKNEEI